MSDKGGLSKTSYYWGRVWFGFFLVFAGMFIANILQGAKDEATLRVILEVLTVLCLCISGLAEW